MDMNNEDLLVIALKCVIDIMCIHGVEIFNENRNDRTEDKSANKSAKRKSNTFKNRKSQSSYINNTIESDSDISGMCLYFFKFYLLKFIKKIHIK